MSQERNRIVVNGPTGPVLMQVGAIPKVGDSISVINLWTRIPQGDRLEKTVGKPTPNASQAVFIEGSWFKPKGRCFCIWIITAEHTPLLLKFSLESESLPFFEAEEA
jgi:hypothetical protein